MLRYFVTKKKGLFKPQIIVPICWHITVFCYKNKGLLNCANYCPNLRTFYGILTQKRRGFFKMAKILSHLWAYYGILIMILTRVFFIKQFDFQLRLRLLLNFSEILAKNCLAIAKFFTILSLLIK